MTSRPDLLATSMRWAPALLAWALAWAAMLALDGQVDVANLAMVLVVASALATLWLPIFASLAATAVSVLAFNWSFVPPRHTLAVDMREHALLLGAMLVVSWIVAGVVARQRLLAERARRHARRAEQLRSLSEALRDVDDPAQRGDVLRTSLAELLGSPPHLLLLREEMPPQDDPEAVLVLGEPSAHELSGLWHCMRSAQPFGPGTDRHANLPEWYFPLRGRHAAFGAAMLALGEGDPDDELRVQAQALCDQMGSVLQRAQAQRSARSAHDQAQSQSMRNALLAAISHDYRTPLASIMGAASSLCEQGERLTPEQRRRLAETVVDETRQLSRLTDNTLQLARLDAPGVRLQLDWESPEEIVGAALRRTRAHDTGRRVHARLEPGLPLVRCDALLLAQLLENLIDNALKYSSDAVEIVVRRQAGHVVFAVRDRGPGVEPAWRERIFQAFQRGELAVASADAPARRGAGVGLAVCRAIARAHGGELRLRARAHGGASFECWLPEQMPPAVPTPEAAHAARP